MYIQYQNDQFFLPFSVNCSQVALLQKMPALCLHGQAEGEGGGSGQPNLDRPGQGEGGPKNSQICADILLWMTPSVNLLCMERVQKRAYLRKVVDLTTFSYDEFLG